MDRRSMRIIAILTSFLAASGVVLADEPAVTTLADFEDDSLAVHITDLENVTSSDCLTALATIPARRQRALEVQIGATTAGASAACDLRFRVTSPFEQADRIATYAWVNEGAADIGFRIRDASGRLFETREVTPARVDERHRWIRVTAALSAKNLRLVDIPSSSEKSAEVKPTWPIEVQGYRVTTKRIGRQTVYLDDLEVEHRVPDEGLLRGTFLLDHPTHIYAPGSLVRAEVDLENISRKRTLALTVQSSWLRADGTPIRDNIATVNLPASGTDYRSHQSVFLDQVIGEPGLYRMVARVRARGWNTPAVFETTIAVTQSNRSLPRGRATFFGVRSNLLSEPLNDQWLELQLARDIGVQLLALDTPWRLIEPQPGRYDFSLLSSPIDVLGQLDIAAMIVMTEPPDWVANDLSKQLDAQARLFEALGQRFGERIVAYQLTLPSALSAADFPALGEVRARVLKVQPAADIVTPPIRIALAGKDLAAIEDAARKAGIQIACGTSGDSLLALGDLEKLGQTDGFKWDADHLWQHDAEALADHGKLSDAINLLRFYVAAAARGVGGVIWFDLRDDTNDPRHLDNMRGLVKRDFSPKAPLLGFTSAVGMLNGLLYASELRGTPPEYDSAVFLSGNRQVAVLLPKPNRILPAVVSPDSFVTGQLQLFDFERRLLPIVQTDDPMLIGSLPRPLFLTFDSERAQSEPQLFLRKPWLRMPRTVLCDREATFRIEVEALRRLRRSYLQLTVPPNGPIRSSFSASALKADAGETLTFDVPLTRAAGDGGESTPLTVRLSVEGDSLDVPIEVRPCTKLRPLESTAGIEHTGFVIGKLLRPGVDPGETAVGVALHAAYEERRLHLAVELPSTAASEAYVVLGMALEGADQHVEVVISELGDRPRVEPLRGTDRSQITGWRARRVEREDGTALCHLQMPTRSLGLDELPSDKRLLLAVRYVEPAAVRWLEPRVLEWGSGLGDTGLTTGYRWLTTSP